MNFSQEFKDRLLTIEPGEFQTAALEVFGFQYHQNELYRNFSDFLGKTPSKVRLSEDIPFLPISFFKSHTIKSGHWETKKIFSSSTTSGSVPSLHHVADLEFYEKVSLAIFEGFYGEVKDYHILALLPTYLERSGSSLVYMVEHFIGKSKEGSGFYLHDHQRLISDFESFASQKVLLLGVSFALWDLAQTYGLKSDHLTVMETGGMKGKKREIIREELHQILCNSFSVSAIHSEYGMTEMFSQAYAKLEGRFVLPPWCKVFFRQTHDPLSYTDGFGGINVIDLANIDTCCFLETSDLGRNCTDGSFEVVGRLDNSDVRGCNLMY